MPLVTAVREALSLAGDPERAAQQQAYMKSRLPYYGVRLPEVRKLTREALRAHPVHDQAELVSVVEDLWDNVTHREEWYAALTVLMAPAQRPMRSPSLLPLYEHLIVTGAWWDVVDDVATHAVREQLLLHPDEVKPVIRRWANSDGLWCRRATLVCQVGAKNRTQPDLLAYVIERTVRDDDFFIRKGIGWALRDYSKTDATWVRGFIDQHRAELSALSVKEASKYL